MANITIFEALASPTRRDILALLRAGPHTVNELTQGLSVTQPAVSQHLSVLRRAGLVRYQRNGTQRLYHLDREGLLALRQYVESFWEGALESYKQVADRTNKEE